MLRLSFFVRELPLAAAIALMGVPTAMSASAAWAGDAAGKSTGGGMGSGGLGGGADKDGGRNSDGARQTRSLYTFERGLNGELIVRDATGRRVGTGTRDDVTKIRTQDR